MDHLWALEGTKVGDISMTTILFHRSVAEVRSGSNSHWAEEKGREWCGTFQNFDGPIGLIF
jgi:hypothetical protein